MLSALKGPRLWIALVAALLLAVVLAGLLAFRVDILRTSLDPRVPFQTYQPPRAPDYGQSRAWALLPAAPERPRIDDPPADVFFVHPTTYDGGEHWNAPFRDGRSARLLEDVMLPNYAGPFARVGRVFAPRYRQASLYAQLTLRDDARDARAFAYGDVLAAFRQWKARYGGQRPFILAGVEQGGLLASRLLAEEIVPDAALRKRLTAVYLIETVVPAEAYAPTAQIPACSKRQQTGCLLAWRTASAVERAGLRDRALTWGPSGALVNLGEGVPLCVNPLSGAAETTLVPARANVGAANATRLDWGDRPALVARAVEAQCVEGFLAVSRPKARSLRPTGGWADRLKATPFNLFYGDIEADAEARLSSQLGRPVNAILAPPITRSISVRTVPVRPID
jgi:hypothetical protein